ncbi:hypothetical protein GC101_22030 [Paenibacillus sp. LMG 31459]|uniref:Uncharacterized protein n=1 Tax=Paenibacillus phytohabitans TaxID=2654978 RepID=A0ABX1YP41_9BACL|nr:hypothetical protein [Paenibacillus phytohabitans]NOU81545.1 hypothetical protein [Paenibacillus phytohabitans]
MKKRKFVIAGICGSALVFLMLFIRGVVKALDVFKNPDHFTLLPWLYCLVLLVLTLAHFGVYVMIMDRKPMTTVIVDEEEWWKKWDRV